MSQTLRILHICAYTWDIGGPPKVIYDNAVVQLANGASVTILTPISEGQKLYPLPEGANIVTCKRHALARFWAEFSPELYQWLKKHGNQFDVIHIHGIWHFASVAPFILGLNVAKCITVHGLLDPWAYRNGYWKKRFFRWLFQKKALQNAEMIHVFNKEEAHDVTDFLGEPHRNMVMIPNGIDLKPFEQLPPKGYFRQKLNFPADKKVILFLSRINIKKGLDLLLPAVKELAQQRNDFILALAGPDDGYLAITQEFIREHQAENYIQWIGMKTGEEKLAAFADADLFVLPSHSEGFSIATLEALVAGTPSVLSDKVGFAEQIIKTQSAVVIALTSESIREGIVKILDNQDFAQKIAQNAQELVKTQYDIRVVGKRILQEFEKIKK
ncbi:MAG: glycosyltransferase [Flectobacillus sp.]|uniref:glycosyltransferase n=1 Tax=Flectobacillus sp. TaxID=50419 RepID=UPI003B9970F9